MRKKEEEEEKAFYKARGIKLKPEYEAADAPEKKQKVEEDGDGSAKHTTLSKVREN
jgi:hypothetical protein